MALGIGQVLTRRREGARAGAAPVAAAAAALGAALALSGVLAPADAALHDWLATRIVAPPDAPGAILVAIDEPSLAQIGPWPWSRTVHAALVESLRDAGARTVAFDIVFADPTAPEVDAVLAAALGPDVVLARDEELIDTPQGVLRAEVVPLPALLATGARAGAAAVPLDEDGAVRRMPGEGGFASTIAGLPPAPGGARIAWAGPAGTYPRVSYYQALGARTDLPPGFLAGADVIVGFALRAAAQIDKAAPDHFRTPWTARGDGLMPGIEVHANVLDTLRLGRWVAPAPAAAVAAFGASLAAVVAFAVAGRTAWLALALAGAAALAPLGVAAAGLTLGIWTPPAAPVAAALVGGIAQTTRDYARERALRRAVTSAFRHYLAPALVDRLARDPSALRLGGERRRVTVLFCDLRGFTALSEAMKDDPEGLTALVNRALTPVADAVLASGGAIDKFIGDCVMGLWNAPLDTPDHARRAVEAATGIVLAVEGLEAAISAERRAAGLPPLRIACGIGINTGDCVVGNMGTATRFDYTAIGDAVNLAARLEGRTKEYGLPVLIGEDAANDAAPLDLVMVDRVAVKGRSAPVDVFTPLALFARGAGPDIGQAGAAALQSEALAAYRRRDWDEAEVGWRRLAAEAPAARAYAALMCARAARFAAEPPEPGWAGEWRFDEK